MGKSKKGLSDKIRHKQKHKTKLQPLNPFEIKVNKVKHVVVNKKMEKWEKGLPGVSRSKAIKKRKDTLLNELYQMKKTNSLHDKRIGEKNSSLTPEEKMVQRFALERKMKTNKQDAFNLNEEEVVLTHYGQSLAENLKDKPDSDSEDEGIYAFRENTGKFQFGGFSANGDEGRWKDKMAEVIADSKKQKMDRQMKKEKSYEATIELNSLWKAVAGKIVPQRKEVPTRPMSTFMMLSRSLIMEQCSGGAADKIKSEEQKAREEADRLKKLEALRLARMRGEEKLIVSDHVSADSLDSGYSLNRKGKSKVTFATSDDSESRAEEKIEDDDSSEEEDGDNNGSEEDSDEDEESGSENEDNYSDLDDDDDNESDEVEGDYDSNDEKVEEEKLKKSPRKPVSIMKKSKAAPLKPGKDIATSDIPYTFDAPDTYDELKILLRDQNTSNQITTVSRLRKCFHPSLAEDNKEKLKKIHLFLLQYYGEIAQDKDVDAKLVDSLAVHLWEMTQTFPSDTAKFLQGIVLEKQKEYTALVEKRGGRGLFPSIETFVYLRLIEMLFPTSDFRHEVTTPAIHFIAQMLAESSIKSLKDVTCGLYLSALSLQYIHSSKRYMPEVITFLHGVLYLASSSAKIEAQPFPPLRKPNRDICQIDLKKKCDTISSQISLSQVLKSELSEQEINELRCNLLGTAIELLHDAMNIWSELPCLPLVMKPFEEQLKSLPFQFFPETLQDRVKQLSSLIDESKKSKLKAMQHESKRPEPLHLFEPKFQESWTGKAKKGGPNREANNRQRLMHKYKREMKAAVREIKQDNAVLAQHRLEITMKKDAERKRKVKELMGSLANQEGDYKAIMREKE